jgi:hypothetical protein
LKKNTPRPERNDLLASALALAARVRSYRESDLAKLQELFHKNYPELVTPECGPLLIVRLEIENTILRES